MYELKEEVARKNIVNVKVKIYETFSIDSAGKTRRGIFTNNVKTIVRECCEIKGYTLHWIFKDRASSHN